ncbi:hypothetical protein Btru_038562 [Bulinus truncatus]|nr:hypothetical protein Btru_038562 [Bulinus truncatus]
MGGGIDQHFLPEYHEYEIGLTGEQLTEEGYTLEYFTPRRAKAVTFVRFEPVPFIMLLRALKCSSSGRGQNRRRFVFLEATPTHHVLLADAAMFAEACRRNGMSIVECVVGRSTGQGQPNVGQISCSKIIRLKFAEIYISCIETNKKHNHFSVGDFSEDGMEAGKGQRPLNSTFDSILASQSAACLRLFTFVYHGRLADNSWRVRVYLAKRYRSLLSVDLSKPDGVYKQMLEASRYISGSVLQRLSFTLSEAVWILDKVNNIVNIRT